jgi:hypothetical protein
MDKNIKVSIKGESEDALQQKCYFWFWNTYPNLRGLLFHVPNGGSRNAREGAKFKQIGVFAGVSDLLFMFDGKTHCIELKNEKGSQSTKQLFWQKRVEENGFNYYIIRTLEDFQKLIKTIVV